MSEINSIVLNGVTYTIGGSGSGVTADIKAALLQLASKVAYIDEDGQDYYDALDVALNPPANLASISAVYTQGGTVYTTDSLDSLKTDLVVTAHYDDSSTATITSYTLSGTLSAGTSTITVSYGGKTTTFNVTVTDISQYLIYNWDFKTSATDTIGNKTFSLSGATRDSNGLHLASSTDYAYASSLDLTSGGRTYEFVADIDFKGSTNNGGIFFATYNADANPTSGGVIYKGSTTLWNFYNGGTWINDDNTAIVKTANDVTFKITIDALESGATNIPIDGIKVYINGTKVAHNGAAYQGNELAKVFLGARTNGFYDATIKTFKIYDRVL